jgi:dTMP kinase
MSARGRFITLEGIDGAGKSSHLEHLCALARAKAGGEVLLTREPGGTPFGLKLREVVLHHQTSALAEALAMFADRSAHVESDLRPALAAGKWVVCDRFSDSTYAYQCGGRGLDPRSIVALEEIVHPDLQPDATFLFDIDPAAAFERQRLRGGAADAFERRDAAYFVRVRDAYLRRAREHAARFHVIDATGSLEQVRARVSEAFAKAFP